MLQDAINRVYELVRPRLGPIPCDAVCDRFALGPGLVLAASLDQTAHHTVPNPAVRLCSGNVRRKGGFLRLKGMRALRTHDPGRQRVC